MDVEGRCSDDEVWDVLDRIGLEEYASALCDKLDRSYRKWRQHFGWPASISMSWPSDVDQAKSVGHG